MAISIGGMAQSVGFAMSWPYAERIAILAPHQHDSWAQFWSEVPAREWERERETFLDTCGGSSAVCRWSWLTDWLWFIPIGLGTGLLFSAAFPGMLANSRRRFVAIAAALGATGYCIYALVFTWGTTYPIALAEREIGWIFSFVTIIIGVVTTAAAVPLSRALLRGGLARAGNPHAIMLMQGLWTADGLPLPTQKASDTP